MQDAIAIGVDLVDVSEVADALARHGKKYLSRVFTANEIAYATSAQNPSSVAQRLGARFAAKEATLKALRACERGISPRSIEVVRREDGSNALALHGPAFAAARDAGNALLELTMSHEGQFALAIVIARTTMNPGRSRIWWKR